MARDYTDLSELEREFELEMEDSPVEGLGSHMDCPEQQMARGCPEE